MGHLDEPAFEQLIAAGCPSCGQAPLVIETFLDRTQRVMLADPTDGGKWAHDGEKFIDGVYRVACANCAGAVFSHDDCPRCHQPGGLARALGEPSRFAVPKRCPSCNELELITIALVPATARYSRGSSPKPTARVEWGEPGFHIVAFACETCDGAVVAQQCPLCDAPGPLRPRP